MDEKTLETGIVSLQDRDTTAMASNMPNIVRDIQLLALTCRKTWLVGMCYTHSRGCCPLLDSTFTYQTATFSVDDTSTYCTFFNNQTSQVTTHLLYIFFKTTIKHHKSPLQLNYFLFLDFLPFAFCLVFVSLLFLFLGAPSPSPFLFSLLLQQLESDI